MLLAKTLLHHRRTRRHRSTDPTGSGQLDSSSGKPNVTRWRLRPATTLERLVELEDGGWTGGGHAVAARTTEA